VFATANQNTGSVASGGNGSGANGAGSVTLLGNHSISSLGNITITGQDVSVLGGNTGAAVQNQSGEELRAAGTLNLFNRGAILVKGGVAGPASESGARVHGKVVNIGADPATPGSTAPLSLWVEGGTNPNRGATTSDPTDARRDDNQPNALVRADTDMFVTLGSNPALGNPLDALGNAIGSDYSLVVKGGIADLSTSGTAPSTHYVTALGALQASNLTLSTSGSILVQGGTATMAVPTTQALVASSALILVENSKNINLGGGGALVVRGGTTIFPATDILGLPNFTGARNTQALARFDPSKLTLTGTGPVVLQGGQSNHPELAPLNSARIDAGDEIKVTLTGPAISYSYSNAQTGQIDTLTGKFFMVGGPASGLLDVNNLPVPGSAAPITINVPVIVGADALRGDSVVQTGLATFDNSLLSYIIFAANEETRAARIRRGILITDDPCN
jgi:hypothetical protein